MLNYMTYKGLIITVRLKKIFSKLSNNTFKYTQNSARQESILNKFKIVIHKI